MLQLEHQEELLRMARNHEQLLEAELEATQHQLRAFAVDFRNVRRSERAREVEILEAREDTAQRLLNASRFRDQETGTHIYRVGLYSRTIGQELGFTGKQQETLFRAAQLHDVGKIGVPDAILRKPGGLTQEEWTIMREHTRIGAQILEGSKSPLLDAAYNIALCHHEHFDATGYPQGLGGTAIPLEARIVKLVDTYDALRMPRVYKPAFTHARAVEIIQQGDGRTAPEHFDPDVLRLFERLHPLMENIYSHCVEPETAVAPEMKPEIRNAEDPVGR